MARTPTSPKPSKTLRENAMDRRASAVSREVLQRLGRDQILVDRLVEELETSMASTSGRNDGKDTTNGTLLKNGMDGVDMLDVTMGRRQSAGGGNGNPVDKEGQIVSSSGATMKDLLEQLLRQREGASTTSGSNLLGELKQCIDLESLVVRRCWEMMEEDWFEDILSNTA